jgi:cellulose synthase/poly-beta-1,6-N-acetylglucosamine synthase-like glycosyltransferase
MIISGLLQFLCIGLTLPGSIELLILTIAATKYKSRFQASAMNVADLPRLAIVMPAHNEADGIADCVANLLLNVRQSPGCELIVIADNCQDATADLAKQAGARVLIRHDSQRRGKGYALDFAFSTLLDEDFAGFIVVDADSRVSADFVPAFQQAFFQGEQAMQCRYRVGNPEASPRAKLQNVAWQAFNELRLAGRDRLRVSVGILGNGFALSRQVLESVPYKADSIAEDLEYHLALVKAGFSVRFLDSVVVRADAPNQGENASVQRSRWEAGRFRLIAEYSPALVKEVLSGQYRLLEPLAELWLLPLAFHVLLLLLTMMLPFQMAQTYALLALALVAMHVLIAILMTGGGLKEIQALLMAPFYILWKLTLIPKLLRNIRHSSQWERTGRE